MLDQRVNIGAAMLTRVLLFCFAAGLFSGEALAQSKINIVTFSGATNLPVWIALENGFFAKEGLEVSHEIARTTRPAMERPAVTRQ
jgi:ABC-type nitrate/sulfonate/bicarbonate transport system substrate-binding protein